MLRQRLEADAVPVGAGLPANRTARCMARAAPVFAGKPAPTRPPLR
ncbi:diguanylate cyclase [Pseudomonas putida]|uniref:Diguanylate cyclase n=1 Tax=Pseudomonas putida TaxID=303 RepID=A0A4D6XHH1_PSEPU|nr:diguanylate cyclase [Pseudomonas putida]